MNKKNVTNASDELLEILDMSLYDLMNVLCCRMMETKEDEDYIQFKARNGIDSGVYVLNLSLKKIKD